MRTVHPRYSDPPFLRQIIIIRSRSLIFRVGIQARLTSDINLLRSKIRRGLEKWEPRSYHRIPRIVGQSDLLDSISWTIVSRASVSSPDLDKFPAFFLGKRGRDRVWKTEFLVKTAVKIITV